MYVCLSPSIVLTDLRNTGNQKRKHALVYACIQSLSWDIGAIVVPKFACVGLSLSQAYLIKTAIEFVQNDSKTPSHLNHGYGLIGAFALVFFGFAVYSTNYHAE